MKQVNKFIDKALCNADLIGIVLVSLLLLLYSVYRAATLSFTYDESLSFNMYSALNFMDIVSYSPPSSNNHLINSLLIHYTSVWLGNDDFLFRLPSVLSHLAYMIFTYKISKMSGSRFLTFFGFLLFNMNPFMLDFFSLARGYAMSLAFAAGTLYYLSKYSGSGRTKYLTVSLACISMAVISNLTLAILFAGIVITLNIYWIAVKGKLNPGDLLRKNIPVIYFTVPLAVILFEPVRKLIKYKEFYDGGDSGFWRDTVGSLADATQYYSGNRMFGFGIKAVVIFGIIFMISSVFRKFRLNKQLTFSDPGFITLILLFVTATVPILQHYITGSLFPINRMALFLLPLFFTPLILLASDSFSGTKMKEIPFIFTGLISVFFTINTLINVNLTHTLLWKYDSGTEKMLEDLTHNAIASGKSEVSLGINPLFEPTVNYYKVAKRYDWLRRVTDDGYNKKNYDYYYITPGDSIDKGRSGLEEIGCYSVAENAVLLKKKN